MHKNRSCLLEWRLYRRQFVGGELSAGGCVRANLSHPHLAVDLLVVLQLLDNFDGVAADVAVVVDEESRLSSARCRRRRLWRAAAAALAPHQVARGAQQSPIEEDQQQPIYGGTTLNWTRMHLEA